VRSTRMVPVLLVLMVVAVSCGDAGSVFETASTTSAQPIEALVDAEALAAAQMIVADLGPEPAVLAVGYALDRGFTAGQIADAGLARTLMTDGTIIGGQPELGLQGIFSNLPPTGGGATGGGSRITSALTHLADEPEPAEPNPYEVQITADQWLTGLGIEGGRVLSGLPTPSAPSAAGSSTTTTEPPAPDERERAGIMIALIVELSDLGYSAEQIILGIVLGEVRITLIASDLGPTGCWLLEDSAGGGVVRPTLPMLPGAFSATRQCREAVDRLAPPDTDSTTTTTTAASSTTPTVAADADGITNGLYVGEVYAIDQPATPVWEILGSTVELEVTDDGIVATVDYVQRWAARGTGPGGQGMEQATCIATISMVYFGRGPVTNPLSLLIEPQAQEIVSLEGDQCGADHGFDHTVESALLSSFAEQQTRTLAGSFSGGRFEGDIGEAHGVIAIVEG
jgi:hypothetical protein